MRSHEPHRARYDMPSGAIVECRGGDDAPKSARVVSLAGARPVAFGALRRLLDAWCADSDGARDAIEAIALAHAPEWAMLHPDRPRPGADLLAIAEAPNQRRLHRESEQCFRVLNAAALALSAAARETGRALVLTDVGAADTVSLRGIAHFVQSARVAGLTPAVRLRLSGWHVRAPGASAEHEPIRRRMLATLARRLGVELPAFDGPTRGLARAAATTSEHATPAEYALESIEQRHQRWMLDERQAPATRIAAALLALRASFFASHAEGALLATSVAAALIDAHRRTTAYAAMRDAFVALDDRVFDVPMMELPLDLPGRWSDLRAHVAMHRAAAFAFAGEPTRALDALALDALEPAETHDDCGPISPPTRADAHLYRALLACKTFGRLGDARAEIAAGFAALSGDASEAASTSRAWLHNLAALTHVMERDWSAARREEELAIAAIDRVPGDSATHLKTNLVSNFSVLFEMQGDPTTALSVWKRFSRLTTTLRSEASSKVYFHRLGALLAQNGEVERALAAYRSAYESARVTGDELHAETIASVIGRLHLDRDGEGDRAEAARWFLHAAGHARACGDGIALGRALMAEAVAAGRTDFEAAERAVAADSSSPIERDTLARALRSRERDAIRAQLPRAASKLSRPYLLTSL
jgi:hypothetical protein